MDPRERRSDMIARPFRRWLRRRWRASALARRSAAVIRDESGSTLVEFTIVAPSLILLWVGVLQFGPVLQNYVIIQNAAFQTAQFAGTGRTDATIYTDSINQFSAAASSLSGASATISICSASGTSCTPCSSDSACVSAMTSAKGDAVRVSASMPCSLSYTLFGFGSNCSISTTQYALIQ